MLSTPLPKPSAGPVANKPAKRPPARHWLRAVSDHSSRLLRSHRQLLATLVPRLSKVSSKHLCIAVEEKQVGSAEAHHCKVDIQLVG